MVFGNGNFAAAVPFARVLAGATVVTGFAATLPLAVVLAFATMLGRRRTTAMAFARAASLALAVVHALARVFVTAFVHCSYTINGASLSADKNPSHSAEQQFVETSSFHTHLGIPHKLSKRHVDPARDHGTHPAARHAVRNPLPISHFCEFKRRKRGPVALRPCLLAGLPLLADRLLDLRTIMSNVHAK